MRTIVYKIKECSDKGFIEKKLDDHSHCMRFIYKKLEENNNKELLDYCKLRWNLTDIEIRSIVCNAKQIRNSFETKIKQTESEIKDLISDLEELTVKITDLKLKKVTEKRKITLKKLKNKVFKLKTKLARKQAFLKTDIVFGSKKLLRELSYLSNFKENNYSKIKVKKQEYTEKRNGTIFLMGEANQKGNRFFDFDLVNKTVIYKPSKGIKIEFKLSNRVDKYEKQLQEAINNKQIAITVSFNNESLSISYDEATLCGFAINKTERKNDLKELGKHCITKAEHDLIVNKVYKDYYDRLRQRQLSDKLSNRYLGIDLNPEHIGYSIIDLNEDKTTKIINTGSFNFKKLMKKSYLSSDSEESIFVNNKRKHERKEVICELFNLIKHYKVGHFVMEDLEFKSTNKQETKEFNRKTKNIWDRELLSNLINKKCTEGGYQLIKVNPVYTSLIGNLSYQVFDPVAASLEISRRGATKYETGGFFPEETVSTIHTTEVVAKRNHIDVGLIRDASWKERYTILTDKRKKFRYRWGEKVGATFSLSLKSYKSKLKHTQYCVVLS